MKNYYWLIGALIAIMFLGFVCGRSSKKCPQIEAGVVTVRDSVVIHDTIRVEIPVEKIVVKTRRVPVYITRSDSGGQMTVEQIEENLTCYSARKVFDDSAAVDLEICSRALPARKPLDLSWSVNYLPPPERIRIETRIDTVSARHFWRDAKLCGAAAVVGGVMGIGILTVLK